MRIYKNFPEAINEIARDLKEMGITVNNTHMQDKVGSFPTYELYNYGYVVLEPRLEDLEPTQPWADLEWAHRVRGINGEREMLPSSFSSRADEHMVWTDYIELGGHPLPAGTSLQDQPKRDLERYPQTFSYTYGERLGLRLQVVKVIQELERNPDSRQLYIAMWDPNLDIDRLGRRRVPCSLGWHVLLRGGALHLTYTMRSCDFVTHFQNDLWLSFKLQQYIAEATGHPTGQFTHFVNSLHVYQKDVKDVF